MPDPSLRQALIARESRSSELENHFRKELKTMLEKSLKPREKLLYGVMMCLQVALFLFFAYFLWSAPAEFPITGRLVFLAGMGFNVAFFAVSLKILRKGSIHLIRSSDQMFGIVWVFLITLAVLFLLRSGQLDNEVAGVKMVVDLLVYLLLFGVPAAINIRMNRTESALREQMLRMELRLEEMREELKTR